MASCRCYPCRSPDIRFKTLSDLADEKFAEMDKTIARADAGDFDGALALVKSDLGRSLMEEIRANVDALRTYLGALREQDMANLNRSAVALRRLTALGASAIVLLTLLALTLSTRHGRELSVARHALTTANERLEARVQERTRELRRANDEVQRYAYIVSHDLRAPLINITGFTGEISQAAGVIAKYVEATKNTIPGPDMAQVTAAIDEDIPEALRFIRASLTRMDNLISEILKLSRMGRATLTPERINVAELALDCVAVVRRRLDEAGGEAALEGELPTVVSDRNALQQIFTNLLDNAVKFFDRSRPGRIAIRGRLERGRAYFEVADNGRGVKPGDLERIFELFRRSGVQDTAGDGIGLAHVRMLARKLGGDIDATSDGSSGTVFRFSVAGNLVAHLREHGHG